MEKDIDKIPKNAETDIVIRVDDFGGRVGLTIREFVKSERYTGFTKAGTRIPLEHFKTFKAAINSIDEAELAKMAASVAPSSSNNNFSSNSNSKSSKSTQKKIDVSDDEMAM